MSKTTVIINIVGTSLLMNYLQRLSKEDDAIIKKEFGYIENKDFVEILKSDVRPAKKKLLNEVETDDNKKKELAKNIANFIKNYRKIYDASAEINSLTRFMKKLSIKDNIKEFQLYLLYTNTTEGEICSDALTICYTDKGLFEHICSKGELNEITIKEVRTEKIKDLRGAINFNKGISEYFIKEISKITDKHKNDEDNVFINATGGFKAQSVYATLTGMLQKVPVIYIFQEFEDYIELPAFPLSFDLALFHKNRVPLEMAMSNNEKAYSSLPEVLQSMFIKTDEGFELSPIGTILYNNYINAVSPKGRIKPECSLIRYIKDPQQMDKVINYIKTWDTLWEGDQLTQMVDHQHNHHQNVLNIAEMALSQILKENSKFLTNDQIYFLVSSIFLHDIGHGRINDKEGNLLNPDDIRKRHGKFSHDIILESYEKLGLEQNEAHVIALLCKYHQKSADEEDKEADLNQLRSLSINIDEIEIIIGFLRIFDASDAQRSRVGEEDYIGKKMEANEKEKKIYEKLLNDNESYGIPGQIRSFLENRIKFIEKQEQYFNHHKSIELVEIEAIKEDNDKWTLKIICTTSGKNGKETYEMFKKNIDEELKSSALTKTVNDALKQKGITVLTEHIRN